MHELFITSNIGRLEQNFIRWSEKVPDMSEAFNQFVPQFQKSREGWLLAGRTVEGKQFAPLSPGYAIAKERMYGQRPILVAKGNLLNAIRGGTKYGMGFRQVIKPKSLYMEIALPYASYHQDGTSKMPQRNYFLTKDGTLTMMDYAQLIQAMEGSIDIMTEAILNKGIIELSRGF